MTCGSHDNETTTILLASNIELSSHNERSAPELHVYNVSPDVNGKFSAFLVGKFMYFFQFVHLLLFNSLSLIQDIHVYNLREQNVFFFFKI